MDIITLGKYGRFAPPNGATSGYLMYTQNSRIVVDFGSGCLSRLIECCDVKTIDAIILTHLHFDHISDMFTLAYYLTHIGKSLTVYAPNLPADIYAILTRFSVLKMHTIEGDKPLKIGGFNVLPVKVDHLLDTFAVCIDADEKRVVYTSDLTDMTPIIPYLNTANLVIGDACLLESKHYPKALHLSVADLAKSVPSHVQLCLAHLSYGEELDILTEGRLYHNSCMLMPDSLKL